MCHKSVNFTDESMCVCARACVCVCVCGVLILFHREGFFRLQDIWEILEGYRTMMLCCEY